MPGHFGQKILNSFGMDHHHHHHQGQPYQQPPPPGDNRLAGNRIIHNDERLLSSHPAGTYPRLARLSDGRILASFTRFYGGGERALLVSISSDNGHTFTDHGEVTRGHGDVDNTFLLEVGPGVVLAAFRNHDNGPNGPVHFRITVCRSTDSGRTWAFASQAAEKPAPLGIWEPFMRLGRRPGEIQLTYSQEFAHDNQCTMLVRSFDQGSTWSPPHCLHGAQDPRRDGMNGIARTWDNGREALVMVFETTSYGTFDVEALLSYDDGETWGWRHQVYVPPRGHNAGAPQIASLGDGSLAVIFMTDEDCGEVSWTKNACVKVVFGAPPVEGRVQWTQPTAVCGDMSHWPGIFALDERRLLALYECGGPKAKTIALEM
ncbi:neuraminidase [Aspergillus heteromorphus CBS 117.55]|uniref:Neuraminidase n=1 Tax=Aspergillus heteromorphus CBS 117.55 TaxID=1448321 RepID=A0A317VP53_9EURO|nr:neuraminidase [Aspergillus heteromorphus CBS 117.55]PWY75389.1 neuraminidase [Aspergillus heteromorphus CBS 117.55]